MSGGVLIREARRRAGLTQVELAHRVGTTQSAIPIDDSNWSVARSNLALDIDSRVRQHQAALRFARAGRAAASSRRG
jgi:hypothetical protein